MSARLRTTMRVAIFFVSPSQARWLFICFLSILYCFPTQVMKSIIMSAVRIPICSSGILRYSKAAMSPRYPLIFADEIAATD